MKLYTTYILLIIFSLMGLNAFMHFKVIPYVQATADSHMSISDFGVISIVLFSIVCIIIVGYGLVKKRTTIIKYFLIAIAINLVFWIPELLSIDCTKCSMTG